MSQERNNYRLTLPVTKRDHIQGEIDAPVVLVKYGDFECPYCSMACTIVKQIRQSYSDQTCFVFRHFPQSRLHPHAQNAAEAAEVAGAQGKFWQMHDILFEHQPALDNGYLMEYALRLELDITRFLQDMHADVYAPRVQSDWQSGINSGVSSTPTFFINSLRHTGAWDLNTLQAAIEEAANSQR